MSTAVRELTVLGEFKPFGLIAEVLDGKAAAAESAQAEVDKYDYFLFDPDITRDRDDVLFADHGPFTPSGASSRSDHELFIRGNRFFFSLSLSLSRSLARSLALQ